MKKQIFTLFIAATALVGCGGPSVAIAPSADERVFELASGDVKSVITYNVETDDTDITLNDVMNNKVESSSIIEYKFNEDGQATQFFDLQLNYSDDGEFINGVGIGEYNKGAKVTMLRDELGRISEYSVGEGDSAYTTKYEYDNSGNAVVNATQYWEAGSSFDNSYNGRGDLTKSTLKYFYDYETEFTEIATYKYLEYDNNGNWTKRSAKVKVEERTTDFSDPTKVTTNTSERLEVTIRSIGYFE